MVDAQVIIVGHKSRISWVAKLQEALPGAAALVDHSNRGALAGHIRALEIAKLHDKRCIIVEDDAIPVEGFMQLATDWFERMPDALISFYLGTGRPVSWQAHVDAHLARTIGDYITLPRLIHGVCYSIPPKHVGRTLDRIRAMGETLDEPADFIVGRGFGREVVYPVESLVEHRDGESVERHPDGEPRIERRVARNLAAPLMYER